MAKLKTKAEFLEEMKGWLNEKGYEFWGVGAEKLEAGEFAEKDPARGFTDERPWYDYITLDSIGKFLDDTSGDYYFAGDDDADEGGVLEFLFEDAPQWWWDDPDHPEAVLDGYLAPWSFRQRNKIGKPVTRYEYWSHKILVKSKKNKYYHGMRASSAGADRLWELNKLNVHAAAEHNNITGPILDAIKSKTDLNMSFGKRPLIDIMEYFTINSRSEVAAHGRNFPAYSGGSVWASATVGGAKYNDNAKKVGSTFNFGGGDQLPQSFGLVLLRLLTDPAKQANAFDKNTMGVIEKTLLSDSNGNYDPGFTAFDKGQFYKKVLEFLHNGEMNAWDDSQTPSSRTEDATARKKYDFGSVPGMDAGSSTGRVDDLNNKYTGMIYPVDDDKPKYSDRALYHQEFYNWLLPHKIGTTTVLPSEQKAYKNALISAFEGIRKGMLSDAQIAKESSFVFWSTDAETNIEDLSRYQLGSFINWDTELITGTGVQTRINKVIPQSLTTDIGRTFFMADGEKRDLQADTLKFNKDATVMGAYLWPTVKGIGEKAAAVVDKAKLAFEERARGSTVGMGAGPDEGLRNFLDKEYFKENFSGLIPNSDKMLQTKIDLKTGGDDATLTATQKQKFAELLEGVGSITFEHKASPWKVPYRKDDSVSHKAVPFEDILDRFYMMAYVAYLIYQQRRQKKGDGAILLSESFTEWYAVKAGILYRRIWQQITWDITIGNTYAMTVLIIALGSDQEIDDATLDALLDLVGAATEDLAKDVGQTGMPSSVLDQEAGMSESSKEQRERFYKQCALMLNMHELAIGNNVDNSRFHEISLQEGYTSYNGRIHLIKNNEGGTSFTQNTNIINKLISPKPSDVKMFTDITVQNASKLVPYVRLFKVYNHDSQGGGLEGNLEEVEFTFPLYQSSLANGRAYGIAELEDVRDARAAGADTGTDTGLAGDNYGRGRGVGIKEFSWEYDGETPATASKYIKAKLHLYFQNFHEFIRVHNNNEGKQFSYVDLFVSPTNIAAKSGPGYNAPHHLKYEPDYYRIRVDVGYNPSSVPGLDEALQMQNTSFFLVLVDHEIEINDDMTVDIVANYRAYIEEAVDSQKFNALNSPEVKKLRAEHMKNWEDALKDKESGKCSSEQLNKVRSSINGEMRLLVKKQHKSLMTNLLKEDKIHFIDFDTTEIDNFRQNGVFGAIPGYKYVSFSSGDPQSVKDHLKNLNFDEDYVPWSEHYKPDLGLRVYYFYLGDLMYLLMSNLYDGDVPWQSSGIVHDEARYLPGAERTKLLLMDFDYENILSPQQIRHTINIADIPISVDYFFDWYVDNIIKNEVTQMPIGTFVRKILTELITEAMAEVCITGTEGHYVTFQLGSFVAGAVSIPGTDSFIDPITAALFTNKGAADLYTNETWDGSDGVNTDSIDDSSDVVAGTDSTGEFGESSATGEEYDVYTSDPIDDPLGESTLDEAATEENIARASAFVDSGAGAFGTLMESATTNPFRFDVNEFYNTAHLPLPRVPDVGFLETMKNGVNGQYNYIMIYGDFSDPYHSGRGNREEDEAMGTFHLDLGADRGLVKKISFSKNNIPYHRESRMFNQGQAGNLQLSAVYDCNISMIGNTLFLPGMELFVDPYGFGGDDFGRPEERPLEFRSPTIGEIRKYNASFNDSLKAGSDEGYSQSTTELEQLSTTYDNIKNGAGGVDSEGTRMPVKVFSYANLMGIGGYQLITGIQCTVTPGKYETTVKAKHTYTGYPAIKMSQKLVEYRQGQGNLSDADSSGGSACEAILKRREAGLLK